MEKRIADFQCFLWPGTTYLIVCKHKVLFCSSFHLFRVWPGNTTLRVSLKVYSAVFMGKTEEPNYCRNYRLLNAEFSGNKINFSWNSVQLDYLKMSLCFFAFSLLELNVKSAIQSLHGHFCCVILDLFPDTLTMPETIMPICQYCVAMFDFNLL